ncbi:S49 family peptidase [Pseudonocardia xishanensis]|uniref:S49 family peptidase n=1 Tax=Pseudonocardia xishanensis TaxID=630995 RepID=A0ABP8RQT0_9PSEU
MDALRIPDRLSSRLPGRLGGDKAEEPVVPMVRLHGVITPQTGGPVPRSVINSVSTEKVLERAFTTEHAVAVALLINSPGGSPTQSALVGERIRGLAEEHDLPVLAFCEDVAASGGYWLACAADEIYAHPTSVVGSIGVVSSGFGLEGFIERFGIERRLHTAGTSKARLDPFLPEKEEDVAWLTGIQGELHDMFKEWVTGRRGERLAQGADLFTGEVWTGARAAELGLVDGLGTPRGILTERFPQARLTPVEGRRPLLARLGLGAPAAASTAGWAQVTAADVALGLAQAADIRASWARYGL